MPTCRRNSSCGMPKGFSYYLLERQKLKSKDANYFGAQHLRVTQLRSIGSAIAMRAGGVKCRASLQPTIGMKRPPNRAMWMPNINWVTAIVSVEARQSICRLHWSGTKKQPAMATQML